MVVQQLQGMYQKGDWLMFGAETTGLPIEVGKQPQHWQWLELQLRCMRGSSSSLAGCGNGRCNWKRSPRLLSA